MQRWILAVVLVSLTAGMGTSFAQGLGYGGGYQGHSNHGHSNHGHSNHSAWGGQRRTGGGHYDYHPGGYQRHGNHFDYVPGHYDYHQGRHRSNFFGW